MKKAHRHFIAGIGTLIVLLLCGGIAGYACLFRNNMQAEKPEYLYVPTDCCYDGLLQLLDSAQILRNSQSFRMVARLRKLPGHLRPGRYAIPDGTSNYTLTTKLRSGDQEAVKLRFNNIRTLDQLAARVSRQLEMDSASLMRWLKNDSLLDAYGVDSATAICLFIPNTYECWWTTSAPDFIARMQREYTVFWNGKRLKKAEDMDMTPHQVMTLASIVEEENSFHGEQPRIAGLYINRLQRGMPLQSDPTVKFALGDFGRKRLLFSDLETDSPYNTYKYAGLPPGPIRMPSIAAIDAVLDYEHHAYIYMCAKEDFSGRHRFTASAAEHAANARRYHEALDRNRISR